jgi:hypothetical protein
MPTATFEHLGTVTVSGSSTTEVAFTSIDQTTYKNFMVVGSVIMHDTAQELLMRVGNSNPNSYKFTQVYAGHGSAGSAVPTTSYTTGTGWKLTQYNVNASSTDPTAVRITFMANATGVTQMISETWLYSSASNVANFTMTNGRFTEGMPSIQLRGISGGVFKADTVFSLYGLI